MASKLDAIGDWVERARQARYHVAPLAAGCGVTPRRLEQYFHRQRRTCPRRWLHSLCMKDACHLLLEGWSSSTSVTNEFYTNGLLKKTTGSRTYPEQYMYNAQGRRTNTTTWQDYGGGTGAAVTTWLYDGYRGFLTNKVYADGKGPSYTYTAAGRLCAPRAAGQNLRSTLG
jgi:YD repeat-containing protein